MPADGYRLWQEWQQMHYPVRGLPVTDSARTDFAGLDGVVGAICERQFCRRPPSAVLETDSRAVLEECQRALNRMNDNLSDDAARYFDRVQLLVNFLRTSRPPLGANHFSREQEGIPRLTKPSVIRLP